MGKFQNLKKYLRTIKKLTLHRLMPFATSKNYACSTIHFLFFFQQSIIMSKIITSQKLSNPIYY